MEFPRRVSIGRGPRTRVGERVPGGRRRARRRRHRRGPKPVEPAGLALFHPLSAGLRAQRLGPERLAEAAGLAGEDLRCISQQISSQI